MKKKFTVKLNTQFTICFSQFGLSDEEQLGNYPTKRVLINYYLAEYGFDEFDVAEVNGNSLPQAMAEVAKAHQQYMVAHKADFEICQVCQANETNETSQISHDSQSNQISQTNQKNQTGGISKKNAVPTNNRQPNLI